MHLLLAMLLPIVGIAGLWHGFSRMRRYRMIMDIPTSRIRSLAMGLVEIVGRAVPDTLIHTRWSRIECVYFRYEVKEYRRHRSGKHTRHSWDTIDSGENRIPFFVDDDTGSVRVDPDGAEYNLDVRKVFLQRALGSEMEEIDTDRIFGFYTVGDRKHYEYFILPGEEVYVLGTAAIDKTAPGEIAVEQGENERMFLISDHSEKELLSSFRWQMIGGFAFGVVLIAVWVGMLVGGRF